MTNSSSLQTQLRQLKKAIQAEVHRKTGRRPPVLANNVDFEDPITFQDISPNNAWYILPNTTNGNKIRHVYKKSTLNQILAHSRTSPFTRKPITNRNIRKYMNFNSPAPSSAPVVINLTSNNQNHHAASSQPTARRPRHGPFTTSLMTSLKNMLVEAHPGTAYKIKIGFTPTGRATTSFKISSQTASNASRAYIFENQMHGLPAQRATATQTTFIPKFQEFLQQQYAPTVQYKGYRQISQGY